jgi:hypothetical protein
VSSADQKITPDQAYGRITRRLSKLSDHRRRVKLTFGLGLLASVGLAAAIFCLCLDALLSFSASIRFVLLLLSGLCLIFVMMGFVLVPLMMGSTRERVAHLADSYFPQMRNGLVAALQLWRKKVDNLEGYSQELIDAAVVSVERRSRDLNLLVVVDRSGTKRILRLGAGLLGLALLLFVLLPAPLRSSAFRFSHPRTQFQQPPRTQLLVTPGDIQVPRHSDVLVTAEIQGRIPQEVRIAWKEGQANWREESCQREDEREYGHLFHDVKRDILYQLEAGDGQSPQYRITVIDRPRVVKLRLRYQFPTYTGLESQVIEEDGNISAVVGTIVRLEVEANKELATAWLSLSKGERVELDHTGRRAEGQLTVKKEGSYTIHIMDPLGNENQDPICYRIEAVADEPPIVQITFPGENVDLGEEMKLPLSLMAGDDFGLSKMELVHQKIREGEQFTEERWALPLPKPNMTRVEMEHVWDLTALNLIPQDLVAYRVEVWDNDRISGPKKARTQTYTVRFPSIQEILAQVQEEQSLQVVDLEEILEEERVLKERLDQIRRELEIEDQMNWEQKKDVETALERQQEIAQQLAQMAEDMDQTLQRIQEKRLASVEIMEKMEQVRELMEEVATPEMREALEKLQRALQELDPELVRQQMDQLSITQEDFLKRLDRTLSILKRLQAEQRLDALLKRTEEMLQRQEHIREQTGEASEDELADLAEEQERLREDAEGLPGELESLSELMSQFPEMPSQELCEMAEQLEGSELTEQMSQAAKNLSMCSRKSAQKNQEQAAQMLNQLRDNLLVLQNQMGARMRREVASAIKESVRDLLDISQEQERHHAQVRSLDRESTTFGNLAEGQLSLMEAASQVAADIYMAAQKTFFVTPEVGKALGQALAKMGQAMESLERRNASSAARSEKAAMVSLNEAANQLIAALNALSCSCSASGLEAMMQQLMGMSQGQMSINQQTLGLFQQGAYTMEQRAQMARLAAEQEALRRGMEDLLKEFGNRSEILGRLDKLEEEMKKVVDDLAKSEVDQRTLDRQQRILSRLLDAQKSVRRRDYTRRRQSRPGQTVARSSPGELPEGLGEREDQLRQDLLRALNEDYPKAYEDLIRAYFQALSQAQQP